MTSWMKDLGPHLKDDTHILLRYDQFLRLDAYDSIGQPTSPSVGRAYRTKNKSGPEYGLAVEVEPDADPAFVIRRARQPLFLDRDGPYDLLGREAAL